MKRTMTRLAATTAMLGALSFGALAEEITLVYGDWQAAQKAWNASLTSVLAEFEANNPDGFSPVVLGR